MQEVRASNAVAQLRKRLALTAKVLRGATPRLVPTRELVPGNIVELSAGNLVPADGVVLEARDFLVSEASLTGESFPVEKQPGVLPAGTAIARRTNTVYLGTSVRSGTARVLVVHTGDRLPRFRSTMTASIAQHRDGNGAKDDTSAVSATELEAGDRAARPPDPLESGQVAPKAMRVAFRVRPAACARE